MINKEEFYWKCRRYGLGKLAEGIGLSPSGIQKKMYDPTNNFRIGEYIKICRILHPEIPTEKAMSLYIEPNDDLQRRG